MESCIDNQSESRKKRSKNSMFDHWNHDASQRWRQHRKSESSILHKWPSTVGLPLSSIILWALMNKEARMKDWASRRLDVILNTFFSLSAKRSSFSNWLLHCFSPFFCVLSCTLSLQASSLHLVCGWEAKVLVSSSGWFS